MKNNRDLKSIMVYMLFFIEALLVIFVSTFSVLLSGAVNWMFDTWSHLTMDELMYQLNAPFDGTNTDMVMDFVYHCVPPAVLMFILVIILLINFRKNKKVYHLLAVLFLVGSFFLMGIQIYLALKRLDVENYSKTQDEYTEYVNDNYIDAGDVNIVFPEQKRNLIYIFLESMEITYADQKNGGAYDQNYIRELTMLAQENEDFSGADAVLNGGYSMPATTWTMGGMFAQTSGFPLSISQEDAEGMDEGEAFMPDIISIGDILDKEGYSQVLHIGSDANFGGRKAYFTEHGDYAMKDYFYARDKGRFPKDYHVWWGYEDARLFEYAKKEILELAEDEEPFNFTMLTVDTHFEDGYVCNDCPNLYGENQYANVLACSSKKVFEFVKWIQRQDFYENTTIVISGDHPTMDSDFCANIDKNYVRKVYTTYINSAVEPVNGGTRRDYTTFDNFPTTLASMGVSIEGDRLGLGTNLFSGRPTLTEQYGRGTMEGQLEDKLPQAKVTVEKYDVEQAEITVSISDFHNVRNGVTDVRLAVWSQEDQSDMKWIPAEQKSIDRYEILVPLSFFEYRTGNYTMHAYLSDQEGRPWMLGCTNYLIDYVERADEPENTENVENTGYIDYTDDSYYIDDSGYTGSTGYVEDATGDGNIDNTDDSDNTGETGDPLDSSQTGDAGYQDETENPGDMGQTETVGGIGEFAGDENAESSEGGQTIQY